jgi:Ca2+-binding EF-hand superfamily protein
MATVGGQFSEEDFDKAFIEMDNDGNGVIEKEEMAAFLQNIYQS